MRSIIPLLMLLAAVGVGVVESSENRRQSASPLSEEGILEAMTLAKDFQERGGPLQQGWIEGTFYGGVFACYEATGREAFLNAARKWTKTPFSTSHGVNADAICTAQTFLDVYRVDQDESLIAPIKKIFEAEYFGADVLERKKIVHAIWKEESRPFIGRNLWWWCDALYMAPPVIARMGKATGDPRYLKLLHKLYWDSVDYLYNPEAKLFFRDKRFFNRKAPNGEPIFWGRGNGWVIGGLVRTIDYIPESDPMRKAYIKLFRDMMSRLVTLQGDDGLWRSSLNDPTWFPMPESSGSGFFVFGLAAGLNRGWLEGERYREAAKKGWKGLVNVLSPDGKVQWSQPVADHPFETHKEDTRAYTQGAFLLAAAEMYKLMHVAPPSVSAIAPKERRLDGGKPSARTFARYVPERIDDFAWENDKIAFRAYGPKARKGAENSGIDCWLKRVDYPIIDKWYGQMKTKSYHKDWGEGHDPYHVGSSAGCGGTGIWLNGKREPLETYIKQELIECTPQRSQFKLTYEREIGGDVYGEEKTITIELGKRLFDVHSVFTKNGKVASGLPVCIGLTTHDGKAETFSSEENGWIACWEKIAGYFVGTGVSVDSEGIVKIEEVKSEKKDESHIFIIVETDDDGGIDYKAGYGWERAGTIKYATDWTDCLGEKRNVPLPTEAVSKENAAFVSFIPVTDANPATDENGYAGSGVNSVAYNQHNLLTVGDQQFIAYYRRHATDPDHPKNNTVTIGRRNIEAAMWEIFSTDFHSYDIDDEHNVIGFAIDGDGFMHMSWGMHSDDPRTKPFQYARSTAPILGQNPIVMTSLGPNGMTGHELEVCYPRFQTLPDGDVLFLFRKAWSGNGDWYLNRYDVETECWSPVHKDARGKPARLFRGRGPHPNNCFYADRPTLGPDGVFHLAGVFRYNTHSPSGHDGFQTNHRYVYLRSLDEGLTWQRMDGSPIALPAVESVGFAGHDATHLPEIVEDIPEGSSLMNQSGMTTDRTGSPIIANWWADNAAGGDHTRQQYIFFYDGQAWQKRVVTTRDPELDEPIGDGVLKWILLARPVVITDADDRIIVIYTDYKNHGILISHSEPLAVDPEREKWTQFNLTHENLGAWEPTYDEARWRRDGVLQMLYQKMPGSGKSYHRENRSTPVSVFEWNAREYFKER